LILVIGIVLALFFKGGITGLSVVEGSASSIISTGTTELAVLVDGAPLGEYYNATYEVVITDAGAPLISFNFDFTAKILNLSQILIDKVPGAIAVTGVEGPKSVYVESLGNDAVCVRDVEVSTVTAISADCSSPLEFVLLCDGSTIGSYFCVPDGDKFVVGGLVHSAVKSIRRA
jgi:hypothetical protein